MLTHVAGEGTFQAACAFATSTWTSFSAPSVSISLTCNLRRQVALYLLASNTTAKQMLGS